MLYIHIYTLIFFQICFNCKEIQEMGVLNSFSIKIFLSDEMDLRLFYFLVTLEMHHETSFSVIVATFTAWKLSTCRVFSGLYFPVFGLNTEIYGVSLCIQFEYRKIQTRKISVFGHFSCSVCWHVTLCMVSVNSKSMSIKSLLKNIFISFCL